MHGGALFVGICAAAVSVAAQAAPVADVFGGRIACALDPSGVQFCEGDVTTRVESWDGVPLDVNVTIPPAAMDGPFPLIVSEQGWSLPKEIAPSVERALAGYVVLSSSSRGFGESCGSLASRAPDATLSNPNACDTGWTHLGDARYELRDSQYLAGLLADEGLVIPDKIGFTGGSYGGGRTIIAAALRDRLMMPDGTLVPWQSPGGLDMAVAAGAALIPWSDLPASLTPNGATLDYRDLNPFGTRGGVRKNQWNQRLFTAGALNGFYAPAGVDPAADLIGWDARTRAGEPYDADPFVQEIIDELTTYHSGYYIDDSVPPAPLFIYNAWTDDLFPANEGLRFWLKTDARHPGAEMAILFADDFGHSRASLAFGGGTLIPPRVDAFFERHLKGSGPALPVFEVFTQGCRGAPALGPFTADDWEALHPGEVRFASDESQTFDDLGGDSDVAAAVAPLAGSPCRTLPADTDPGAATYVLPAATGDGFTLLGSPTVVADLVVTGAEYAQVAARLWDVAPDGMQTLITRGPYRPRTDNLGPQVFQLPPNGWHFADGHAPKLELLGQSEPQGNASGGAFTVTVASLELRLPVRETPDGGVVLDPAAPVVPPAEALPPPCPPTPSEACAAPSRASRLLVTVGKKPAKDRLTWAWRGDTALDPGTATGDSGATLCLWDDAQVLVLSAPAPESGTCGKKACWSASAKRARYSDPKRSRTAVRHLALKAKRGGTQASLQARGDRLGLPALPLESASLTVQLHGGGGACWGATFDDVRQNDERRWKARSS